MDDVQYPTDTPTSRVMGPIHPAGREQIIGEKLISRTLGALAV
jgi:hypothetical protein